MGHSAGRGGVMKVDTCALDFCACNTEKEKYSPAVTCHELLDGSGRFHLFRRRLLSGVTMKRRKSWLLAASALASSSLGISGPVLAANECGALDASGSVTCTSTTGTGNPYPDGISYARPLNPGDLTVNLAKDVTVSLQTVGTAVSVTNAFGGNVIVNDAGATITAVSPWQR